MSDGDWFRMNYLGAAKSKVFFLEKQTCRKNLHVISYFCSNKAFRHVFTHPQPALGQTNLDPMPESSDHPPEQKNVVSNSTIEAGNNVHIGDVHYHQKETVTHVSPDKPPYRPLALRVALALILLVLFVLTCTNWAGLKQAISPSAGLPRADSIPARSITGVNSDTGRTGETPELQATTPKTRTVKNDPDKEISGMVVGQDNEPLAGAQVTVSGTNFEMTTGKNGLFRLFPDAHSTSEEYRVYCYKDGYLPWNEIYLGLPQTNLRIRMQAKAKNSE